MCVFEEHKTNMGLWWLCIPPATAIVCAAALVAFRFARTKMNWSVNCWFCNTDAKVPYELRNAWTCSECEQYNGFTEAGDYNRDLPEQRDHRLNPRYSQSVRRKRQPPPDLTSLDPPNGLCNSCNEDQALKVRQLTNFEPIDENQYDAELAAFKLRMEKAYPLCNKCVQFVNNTLVYQQQKLGLVAAVRRRFQSPKSTVYQAVYQKSPTSTTSRSRKRRRVHPGGVARSLHIFCVTVASLLFIVDLNNLQYDSQTELICFARYLPVAFLNALAWLPAYTAILSVICTAAQALSMKVAKSRLVLPDLLILPAWVGLVALHSGSGLEAIWKRLGMSKQDLFLCQTALACLTALLAMSVTVLPRKRLSKKRPNFVSAFSIASTPLSQCSSGRESLSSSMNRSSASNVASSHIKTPSAFRLSPSLLSNGKETSSSRDRQQAGGRREGTPARERTPARGRTPARESTPARELTPSRELGGKLTQLSIGLPTNSNPQSPPSANRRGGPFSSLSINASTYRPDPSIWSSPPSTRSTTSAFSSRPLLTPSRLNALGSEFSGSRRFSPPQSQMTSGRTGYWTSNDDADSVLTSASQMRPVDCSPAINRSQLWWNCLIVLGLFVSLTVNALVLYFALYKEKTT